MFPYRGHTITIRRMDAHPYHTFLRVGDREYFFQGVRAGMTRRQVKTLALQWLREHPQHWR